MLSLSTNIGLANLPISSASIDGTGMMLNERAKYTANTGIAIINTANTALDGSGTLVTLLTAASNGTFVKNVIVKSSSGNTAQGIVRLFIYDGTNTRLLEEIEIRPAVAASGIAHSFDTTISLNFNLQSGYILKASTEKATTFRVFAQGLDWTY